MLSLAVLTLLAGPVLATDAAASALSLAGTFHLQSAYRYAAAGRHFLAAKVYRQAIDNGVDGADVRWKLSLALYGLGLIDKALDEIDRAQRLSPEANFLHFPTGIFPLAKGDLPAAAERFASALRIHPGFADAYYNLGEVYCRQGDLRRARLCSRMAEILGYLGDGLRRKLTAADPLPDLSPWRDRREALHLRVIPVATATAGQEVLERTSAGDLFEQVAAEQGAESSQGFGGYAGAVQPAELDPIIAAALDGREPFHSPVLAETAGGLRLVQRIAPFGPSCWNELLAVVKPSPHPVPTEPKPAKLTRPSVPSEPVAADTPKSSLFRVYAGTYCSDTHAQKQLEQLKQLDAPGYIYRQETAAGTRIHVIAGKFASRKEAAQLAKKLRQAGVDNYIRAGK